MKIRLLIFTLILSVPAISGESMFGISSKSVGFINYGLSPAGLSRGFELAYTDSFHVNNLNFSTWPSLSNTTINVNGNFNAALAKDSKTDYYNTYINFSGVLLAIPLIKNSTVLGLGVQQYSSVDQRIDANISDPIPVYEHVLYRGGLARSSITIARKLTDNLNVSLGYDYYFGRIMDNLRLEYTYPEETTIILNTDYRYSGSGFTGTAFYNLNKTAIGMIFRTPVTGNIDLQPESNSIGVNKPSKQSFKLPTEFGIGFSRIVTDRLLVGGDFLLQTWEKGYKIENVTLGGYHNSFRASLGVERKASPKRFVKFLETLDYRGGFFLGELNQLSAGNTVIEYGISTGISMPLIRFRSKVDFSVLLGRRGNSSENLFEENFIKTSVSISASEIWFKNIED
jgi:hypothetical protein